MIPIIYLTVINMVEKILFGCDVSKPRHTGYIKWRTYITYHPGGAITQHGPRAVNHQRPVTALHHIHSLYPACVDTRCSLCLIAITVGD